MSNGSIAEALRSSDSQERLKAARALQLDATADDVEPIRAALRGEDDAWVQRALESALALASSGPPHEVDDDEDLAADPAHREIRRQALAEATGTLTHELRKRIGYARFAAESDIPNYDESATCRELQELANLVDAIDRLGEATKVGPLREFDLAVWIREVAAEEAGSSGSPIEFAGPSNLVAFADPDALKIVVTNAVRNAAEATAVVTDADPPPILVAYGDTDRVYWVSVLDRGPGPPPGRKKAFGKFVTNKPGHRGFGLTLAKNIVESLDGRIDLTARERGSGAELRFEWPKPGAES